MTKQIPHMFSLENVNIINYFLRLQDVFKISIKSVVIKSIHIRNMIIIICKSIKPDITLLLYDYIRH